MSRRDLSRALLVLLLGCGDGGAGGLDDGSACEADDDCASGRCLGEEDGFPGGLCTTEDCTADEDCEGDGRSCVQGALNGDLCLLACAGDADCRPGYACRRDGWCLPEVAPAALAPSCASTVLAQDVTLFQELPPFTLHQVELEVAEPTTSFAVVLYDPDEQTVAASVLRAPDGEALDLLEEYAWLNYHAFLLGYVTPLLVPGAPQFAGWVQPGTYTLEVGTTGQHVCHFLVESQGPGTTLDLNFYFVGVPGLDAASAPEDPDFTQMTEALERLLGAAGIGLGQTRFVDVTGTAAETYGTVATEEAFRSLVRLGRAPGPDLDDLLSIDVFVIRDFVGGLFGTRGIAPGIPSTIGLHGEAGSGLVVSATDLGSTAGDQLTAQVLAHELGHYLGLEHTSDIGGATDHLEDTPECTDLGSAPSCPDQDNLMFPITAPHDEVVITEDQAFVLRANPLVR